MKLGILSDTHNNAANLTSALVAMRKRGVTELIHCGDLTNPATAALLDGFLVHLVFGNGDLIQMIEISAELGSLSPPGQAAHIYTARLDGARIAAVHGHKGGQVDELARSGQYDYVFHGHSHRRRDERIGLARVINPGALGGLRAGPRSCLVIDLAAAELEWIELDS